MKLLRLVILTCALAGGLTASAFANTGSATVTYWRTYYNTVNTIRTSTTLSVSNSSARDVTVTLKLFDDQGRAPGDVGFVPVVVNGGALTGCNATGTVCTLAAGKSGHFHVRDANANVDTYGYGILEWSSGTNDGNPTALVASGMVSYGEADGTASRRAIIITRDQPF